jgi:WD40 repeat protein
MTTILLLALFLQDAPPYARIHELLSKHCTSCHDQKKREGDFLTETHEDVMKGGAEGPVIVPGKPDESLFLALIEHRRKPPMPPPKKAAKLKPEELALFRAWIAAGAPGPKPGEVLARVVETPKIAPRQAPKKGVRAAAYDAATKLLAVAKPHDVELIEDGKVVRTLPGHVGLINAVAAQGGLLAVAAGEPGLSGEVRLWTLADGKPVRVLRGHEDAVYAVAVAPDGRTIASGSYDHAIRLWDRDQEKPLRACPGHNEAVYALGFRADGKVLASASGDRTVKLWDVATGKRLDTLSEPTKALQALAWSPDGRRLAAGGADNRIRVWEISAGALEGTNPLRHSTFAHEGVILRLAWSPDGKSIASSAEDRTVKLWNAADMSPRAALDVQADWPAGLAFSPDSTTLAVGLLDGTHRLFEVATGKARQAKAPAKAELAGLEPRGLQSGQGGRLKVTGKNLAGITGLKIHHAQVKGGLDGAPAADHAWIRLEAGAAFVQGEVELSLTGPAGETNRLKLFVDPLPQVSEAEGFTTLPAGLWGVLSQRGETDALGFDAKAGQTIILDAAARRLGSKAELVLTLTDAAGRVIASNIDTDGEADPLIVAKIPADGRYTLRLRDLMLGASADHWYRITAGELPLVTAVFPLSVPANAETEVRLIGPNVAGTVRVKAGAAGEVAVPVDPAKYRTRKSFTATASASPEPVEVEGEEPRAIAAPGGANGRIDRPGDADLYRFETKAGRVWAVETQAAQRGLPTDTRLEILHEDGRPVQRVLLRAVRDSYLTFRPVDAVQNGGRFWQWEEMDLGQYLYLNGEVVKLFLAPQGPDSEWKFFTMAGKRRNYFDTSATAHPLDEPAYIVDPLPPGSKPTPNGLPLFPVPYRNDDDADRRLGTDSKILFTTPADGAYLVRVTESRGESGERHLYRLLIREAKPDFKVTLEGAIPAVPAGSGTAFTVRVDRQDGFEGPVRVDLSGLPSGYTVSTPLWIEAGMNEAKGTLFAAADATKPAAADSARVKVTATASGPEATKDVNGFGTLDLAKAPRTRVWLEPDEPGGEIVLKPGGRVAARIKIHREGHNERVTFDVENLPFGSIVDDIGLNGILIPEGQTERRIFLNCAAWTAPALRPAYARIRESPNATSAPLPVRVPSRN